MTADDTGTKWQRLRIKVEEGQVGGITDGAPELPKVDFFATEGTGAGGRCQFCLQPVDDHKGIQVWDPAEPIAKTGCPDQLGRYE